MTETAPPTSTASRPNKRLFWIIGGALGVVLIIAAVLVTNALATQAQEQRFLELVAENPAIDPPDTLNEEALIVVFHSECEFVEEGWTTEDRAKAAANAWEGSKALSNITEYRFLTNTMGFFEIAQELCE